MQYNSCPPTFNTNRIITNGVISKLENDLKKVLVELGCDISNSNIMDYPDIIKSQLIHRNIYKDCDLCNVLVNDLTDECYVPIYVNSSKCKLTLGELKKYFGISYKTSFMDKDNNLVLSGLPQGEYTLIYEDENGNILGDCEEIAKIQVI